MEQKRAAKSMTQNPSLSPDYVVTPGGYRHRSFVHKLAAGQAIVRQNGRSCILELASGVCSETPAQSQMQDLAGTSGGWVAWTMWTNATGTPITSFSTTWTVPRVPATAGSQLIYLFNALEDAAGDDILQPVLQWGVSGAGGGSFWAVASWYVDSNGHAFCTPAVPVNEGDSLSGLLTATPLMGGAINYQSEFVGIPGTTLIAQGLSELVMATETLEVYGLTAASGYPSNPMTGMKGINLQLNGVPPPLNWVPFVMSNPVFGEHATVVSNANPGGEVDLYY